MTWNQFADIFSWVLNLLLGVGALWFRHRSNAHSKTIDRLGRKLTECRSDRKLLESEKAGLERALEELKREKAGLAEELKISRAETERIRNDPRREVIRKALKPIRDHIDVYCEHIREERALPPVLEQWRENLRAGCSRWMRKGNSQYWVMLGQAFEPSGAKALKKRVLSMIGDHCSDYDDNQDSTLLERAETLLEKIKELEDWSP